LFKIAPGDFVERGHDDMSSSIFIGAFQLQHNITGAVEFEPFIGDGGAGDITTQPFEAPPIMRYLRMGVVIVYCL
jgi:hypothetical protein